MVAEPNPGRPRLPGCGHRPDHLRRRVAAARRVRRAGTRSGSSTGRSATGRSARAARLPVDARFRRVLARLRVDGRAAPAQGARHLRAHPPPRRQARLRRRTCRASWRTCAARASATRARTRCCALLDALDGPRRGARLHFLDAARDGDDPGRRPRRAHAPAVGRDAQAAARGRGQAARSSGRSRRSRAPGIRDIAINASHLADKIVDALGDGRGARRDASAGRSRTSRSRPPAASPPRCRCSRRAGDGRLGRHVDRLRLRALRPIADAMRALARAARPPRDGPQPGLPSRRATFTLRRTGTGCPASDGPARKLTYGNIGLYDTALFHELPRGAKLKLLPLMLDGSPRAA